MAKPKLALIPCTQGYFYSSVLPSDGSGDFRGGRSGKATRINSQGLIEEVDDGVSRLNYPMIDGKVVGCPHHILEPARTNLIQYSEDFSNAYWTKQDASITSNQGISPDGTLNADLYTTSSDVYDFVRRTFSFTSGNTYTLSIFVKSGTSNEVRLDLPSAFTDRSVIFNIENKTYIKTTGSPIAKIEDYGNGWFRCSITSTATSTSSGTTGFSSAKPISVSTLYLWGAQLEEGSYPTSYIKSNSGSTTTRSAETANDSGDAATFNDSEGVLIAEISALADDLNIEGISISDGSSSNRVVMFKWNSSNTIKVRVASGGVNYVNENITVSDVTDIMKIAIKYKQNDFAIFINGFELFTETSGSTPVGLDTLQFNSDGTGSAPFYGKAKQLQYYNSALTDSELEQLTSWTSFTDMAEGQLYTIE